MGLIDREFNGKIKTYGILDPYRWRNLPLRYMDKFDYGPKIKPFIEDKTVHVVPQKFVDGSWYEEPLVRWILLNHKMLGYDQIVLEKTPRYYELKKNMGFEKFPDLLVYFDETWHRLEVETWAHRYEYCHGNGYADIVWAYDSFRSSNTDIPIFTVKEFFGTKEIISSGEFLDFIYLFDSDFKYDYDLAKSDMFAASMGIEHLPT